MRTQKGKKSGRGRQALHTTTAVMIALGTTVSFAPPQASAGTASTVQPQQPGVTTRADGSTWVVVSSAANLAYIDLYPSSTIISGSTTAPNYLHANIELTANIDMSSALSGTSWAPLGDATEPFAGTFDGQGHIVSGVTVSASDSGTSIAGFFGVIGASGTVENVTVEDSVSASVVTGPYGAYAGGLAGQLNGGTITDAYVNTGANSGITSSADASAYAGGLVGSMSGGTITASSSSGTVTAGANTEQYAGGLVGEMTGGTIIDSQVQGAVSAKQVGTPTPMTGFAGGLVGQVNGGSISGSYASGTTTLNGVADQVFGGGVIGQMNGGTLSNSHAAEGVTATAPASANQADAGGLVGQMNSGASMNSSYATGTVNASTVAGGDAYAGGLAGAISLGSITNSYSNNPILASASVGNAYAGGLAAQLAGGSLVGSHADGTVTADSVYSWDAYAGGLVGQMSGGSITDSYGSESGGVTGSAVSGQAGITGGGPHEAYAGGLAGQVTGGSISDAYGNGAIKAFASSGAHAGGLAGDMASGTVSDSYATVLITAYGNSSATAGGLLGSMEGGGLSYVYVSGSVNANTPSFTNVYNGGVAGEASSGTITYAYVGGNVADVYVTDNTLFGNGPTLPSAVTVSGTVSAISPAQMVSQTSYGGFDFTSTWAVDPSGVINGGMPYLRTMYPTINTANLPPVVQGQAFSETLASNEPGSWSAVGLPSGLTMETNGTIDGVTNSPGTYTVTATLQNSLGWSSSDTYTLDVLPATPSGVIEVYNWQQLEAIDNNQAQFLGSRIELMGDIAAPSGTSTNWTPLGSNTTPFVGTLDGQGYTVSGVVIFGGGFVGDLGSGGVVENLGVSGTVNQSPAPANGLVIATLDGGTAQNDFATGIVQSDSGAAGGLVGLLQTGTVTQSHANVRLVSPGGTVGGLVGDQEGGIIGYSFATGVSQGATVGGLVGSQTDGSIESSYAVAHVQSAGTAGGLVGNQNYQSVVSGSFAIGSVSGYSAGGLVGTDSQGSIENSYSTASADGNQVPAGGIVGTEDGCSITDSYSDGQLLYGTTTVYGAIGSETGPVTLVSGVYSGPVPTATISPVSGQTFLTQSQLVNSASYAGFDFTSTWAVAPSGVINGGMPYLRTMYPMITAPTLSPSATYGQPYSVQFSATGGSGGDHWSATGLPSGLSVDPATGLVSGTPQAPGSYAVTVVVTDSLDLTDSYTYNLNVSLPEAEIGVNYSYAIPGMLGPVSSVTAGSLDGLQLSGTGTLSGQPAATGTYTFTVAEGSGISQTYTLDVAPALAALPSIGQSAMVGTPNYSYTFAEVGGTGSYTWSVVSGTLPHGLQLSPSGVLSGTPDQAGRYPFTVQVTDGIGRQDEQAVWYVDVPVTPLSITSSNGATNATLPSGTVGDWYQQTLFAAGGVGTYSWSIASGMTGAGSGSGSGPTASELPPGITMTTGGVIEGTPSMPGKYTFTVQVKDSSGMTATQTEIITVSKNTVASPLRVTQAFVPGATVGQRYNLSLSTTGGAGTHLWKWVSGTLPPGLTLSSGGSLGGLLTKLGAYTFTLQVADSNGDVATKTFRMVVLPAELPKYDHATLVNGQVYTVLPGWVHNHTAYAPIWYVEQVLKLAGVNATWQANPKRWDLTVDTTSGVFTDVTPHLLYHDAGTPVYVNGTLVLHAPTMAHRDPTDGVMTTYMPIWYVQQVLKGLGIATGWNGHTWDFTLPGVN